MLQSHFGVLLDDSAGSHDHFQGETEEAMSEAALWVTRPMPCLPLLPQHEVLLVDGPDLLAGRPHVPHRCGLDVLETLGTQLSCHPTVGSGSREIGILPWSPIYTGVGCICTEIHACSPTHCLDVSKCILLVQPIDNALTAGLSSTP